MTDVERDLFGVETPAATTTKRATGRDAIATIAPAPARVYRYAGRDYSAAQFVELFGVGADLIPTRAEARERDRLAREIYERRLYSPAPIPLPYEVIRPVADLGAVLSARSEAFRRAAETAPKPKAGLPAWLARPDVERATEAIKPAFAPAVPLVSSVAVSAPLSALTRAKLPPVANSPDIRYLRAVVKNHCRRLHPRNSNLRKCGLRRFGSSVQAMKRVVAGGGSSRDRAHVAGLIRCASVHGCITCAATISAQRAAQVTAVVEQHRKVTRTKEAPAGGIYMLTLTLPHDVGMRPKRLRKHVAKAWQSVQRGAPWVRLKKRMGFVGSIAARETTHGANGFHPHLHILIATRRPLTDVERHNVEVAIYTRWVDAVAKVPGLRVDVPTWENGITLEVCHKANYISKLGLAPELTSAIDKRGKKKNRTPFQIMADYSKLGRASDADLIRQYVRAMKGAKQLTWSRGKDGSTDLRKIYADAIALAALPGQESLPGFESDAEVVAAAERVGDVVTTINGQRWDAFARVMRSAGRSAEWEIIAATESAGAAGVEAVLAHAAIVGAELVRSRQRPHLRKWLPWLAPPGVSTSVTAGEPKPPAKPKTRDRKAAAEIRATFSTAGVERW